MSEVENISVSEEIQELQDRVEKLEAGLKLIHGGYEGIPLEKKGTVARMAELQLLRKKLGKLERHQSEWLSLLYRTLDLDPHKDVSMSQCIREVIKQRNEGSRHIASTHALIKHSGCWNGNEPGDEPCWACQYWLSGDCEK